MNELVTSVEMENDVFRKNLLVAYHELSKATNSITYGPLYHSETSQGAGVSIASYIIGDNQTATKYVLLVEQDGAGDVVGVRSTKVQADEANDLQANGLIIVKDKGKGYSTPLELGHFDLLQRIANQEKKSITYKLSTANPIIFNRLEKLAELTSDRIIDPAYLERRRTETDRWHNQYTTKKFGFDHNRQKIFHPTDSEANFDFITDITLFREGTNNIMDEVRAEERTVDDVALASQIKQSRYAESVLPALKEAAGITD